MNPWQLFLHYHDRTSRGPQGRRVAASIASHLGQVESLLDVGCGDGQNTLRFAEAAGVKRIEGIDVVLRSKRLIEVKPYDGRHIPFPDQSFDAVTIVDVLHHCDDPRTVLAEAVRVSRTMVVIKDHFAFGPFTKKVLHFMDIVGNAKDSIPSPGTYFEMRNWVQMISDAGARLDKIDWPLKTHDLPWSIVGWPILQFTARITPVRSTAG